MVGRWASFSTHVATWYEPDTANITVLSLLPPHGHVAGNFLVAAHAPLTDRHASLRKDWLLLRQLLLT